MWLFSLLNVPFYYLSFGDSETLIPDVGVLRFLSHRTVSPCVSRVEESVILGE